MMDWFIFFFLVFDFFHGFFIVKVDVNFLFEIDENFELFR